MTTDFVQLAVDAGSVFRPHSPIDSKDLFSGRVNQIVKVVDTINMLGKHAILFGERGVGKTSLSNVVSAFLGNQNVIAPKINCDSGDTYTSLWHKVFNDIFIIGKKKAVPGFIEQGQLFDETPLSAQLPDENVSTDHVRRALMIASESALLVLIFDEFDRLPEGELRMMMADTAKIISDHGLNVTLLFVGVADSVNDLISDHQSIERALEQIRMPRMSVEEVQQIIEKGIGALGMTINKGAENQICMLAQGLPYYAHMLGLESSRAALSEESLEINLNHLMKAISNLVESSKESIGRNYYVATKSARSDSIFKQVLLACALSETDEFGYFTAGSVRTPLSEIMGKKYDIPNFSRHLGEFSAMKRGNILEVHGEKHGKRFRFSNPLIQPYTIMCGISNNSITAEQIAKLSGSSIGATFST